MRSCTWINAVVNRRNKNVALANKNARNERDYKASYVSGVEKI